MRFNKKRIAGILAGLEGNEPGWRQTIILTLMRASPMHLLSFKLLDFVAIVRLA